MKHGVMFGLVVLVVLVASFISTAFWGARSQVSPSPLSPGLSPALRGNALREAPAERVRRVDEPKNADTANAYDCRMPAILTPRRRACLSGDAYPACKWHLPRAALSEDTYGVWRNTTPEHGWARPGTVSFLLAAARAYHRAEPEQRLFIGDLDAPGPRHQTHRNGVDVDMYLPGAMLVENAGGRKYPNNYEHKTLEDVEKLQQRVETLARVLATCAHGRLRIYYNDPVVQERFHRWFDAQGYTSPFGRPMQTHNRLHDFHFHVTVEEDMAVLPLVESSIESSIIDPRGAQAL